MTVSRQHCRASTFTCLRVPECVNFVSAFFVFISAAIWVLICYLRANLYFDLLDMNVVKLHVHVYKRFYRAMLAQSAVMRQ